MEGPLAVYNFAIFGYFLISEKAAQNGQKVKNKNPHFLKNLSKAIDPLHMTSHRR
jgi:hypothetical protein